MQHNKTKKTKKTPRVLDYPYYSYIYKPIRTKCYKLAANVRNIIKKRDDGAKIIYDNWMTNFELNELTDIFTENCRVKCQFLENPTPLEYWQRNRDRLMQIVKKTKKSRSTDTDIYYYREMIYKNSKLCNNFRISLVITILKMFKARRWLDISAGWGDRLLGAILTPSLQFYCGVDPNPCVQAGYRRILDFFFHDKPNERAKYKLIEDGFETAKLPNGITYDLVFSSPPFFNLETYSDASSNSLTAFSTEEKWLNGFLLPSIAKGAAVLEPKGHLILYITESKTTSYIPKMLDGVRKLVPDLEYDGKMYYRDAGSSSKPRDFHIWRKKMN